MELQVIEQNAIVQAFQSENGIQSLFDRMAEQARSIVPDVSTKKGRDAIASQAYKVSKSKTAVDNHGKELVAGIKAQAAVIDKDRKAWRDQCDALRDEIRKPLDDWEQAEKDRVAKHENAILTIKEHSQDLQDLSVELIKQRIEHLENFDVDYSFEDYEEQAKLAKFETLEFLRKVLVDREKYEAEQAELGRLRQEEIERQQRERDEQIAREAAENARKEAEQKAQAEREKAEREKLEAEQREARLKAEKEAAELREQQLKTQAEQAAKQAEIDRQNAVEAERKRIEQEAQAKADAELKEQQAREANKAHKKKICNEALQGLMNLGVSEELGKQILQAIHKGEVPHVSIKF